jgi:hypothetical protein
MDPGEELVHEGFRPAFGLVQAAQPEAAADFQNDAGVEPRQGKKLSFRSKNSIGNDRVGVRMSCEALRNVK